MNELQIKHDRVKSPPHIEHHDSHVKNTNIPHLTPGLLSLPENILQLQRTIGNQAVIQLLKDSYGVIQCSDKEPKMPGLKEEDEDEKEEIIDEKREEEKSKYFQILDDEKVSEKIPKKKATAMHEEKKKKLPKWLPYIKNQKNPNLGILGDKFIFVRLSKINDESTAIEVANNYKQQIIKDKGGHYWGYITEV